MLGKASAALRTCVVSAIFGVALVDAFTTLEEYFANDVVSVPAVAPFLCEIKVEACSDASHLLSHLDFVSVQLREWSQYHCHLERVKLWSACGPSAKVVMRYNGPWAAGSVLEDGSWLIQSSAGIVVALLPANSDSLKPDHRCFFAKQLERKSAGKINNFKDAKSIKDATFCVPAIDVVGYPKCGTSAAYELLVTHNATQRAAKRKEMCIFSGQEKVWSWIESLEPAAKQGKWKLLVNGCAVPFHTFSQEVLFRLYERPNIKVFMIRDLADRLWSAWNFWCDPKNERKCHGGHWSKIGVHERSPERFHQLLMDSIKTKDSSFANVPAPGGMSTYYLRRYLWINDLSPWNITVSAKEKLETQPAVVWAGIAKMIKEAYGRDMGPHESLHLFSEVLINTNDHKGAGEITKMGDVVDGTYEISGHRPLLDESRRHIMKSWKECRFWASATEWPFPCVA